MDSITVPTKYGPVQLTLTAADKAVVSCGRRYNDEWAEPPVVINRVEIGFRITLVIERDDLGEPHNLKLDHMHYTVDPKNWRRMNEYPSMSARTKILDEIIDGAVLDYLREHPEIMHFAEVNRLAEEIKRKRDERVALSAQMQTLSTEISQLVAEHDKLIGMKDRF